MVDIFETPEFIYVMINQFPYYSHEDMEKGIVRIYGRDGNRKKINYVKYPTKHYTKEYVEKHIVPQYEDCPKCLVGEEIVNVTNKLDGSSLKSSIPLILFIGAIAVPLLYRLLKR